MKACQCHQGLKNQQEARGTLCTVLKKMHQKQKSHWMLCKHMQLSSYENFSEFMPVCQKTQTVKIIQQNDWWQYYQKQDFFAYSVLG